MLSTNSIKGHMFTSSTHYYHYDQEQIKKVAGDLGLISGFL